MRLKRFVSAARAAPSAPRMPLLFVGHGNPMNAIEDNRWSRAWEAMARGCPRPSAILCVSAHWLTDGTFVHGAKRPKTIHDFWGFPPELYAVRYPCPGDPARAKEARAAVASAKVGWDLDWGVDHGTWSVLRRMYPEADVPVFQLSVDIAKPAAHHYAIGRELAALRERGVLIVGSGNLVHNLGMIDCDEAAAPFDWAVEFDARAAGLVADGDHAKLLSYGKLGPSASLAVPTPDHYFPLLYVLGAAAKDERPSFPVEGIAQGSIGMRCVRFG